MPKKKRKPALQTPDTESRQGLHFQDRSNISVAFHGEVIVEHWEKNSADYRQYIHALPWEGASKASAS